MLANVESAALEVSVLPRLAKWRPQVWCHARQCDRAPVQVRKIFIYCLTWSLGGLLDTKDRPAFDADVRALAHGDAPPKKDDDTVFEYTVNDAGQWVHWASLVQPWEYPKAAENPKFAQLNIPTLDSTRFDALLTRIGGLGKSSLLVGGPGTAKTTVINMYMAKFPVEEVASKARCSFCAIHVRSSTVQHCSRA
jgi:dynein heavy chain, axonemal